MKLLYLLILLLMVQAAAGQTTAPVSAMADTTLRAPQRLTAADTVRALQRLFKNRRTIGTALVATAGTLVALGLGDVAADGGNAVFFSGASAYVFITVIVAIYTAPLYIPGFIIRGRYSKKKEATTIADYNSKKSIPNKYLKRLKPKLFH